MKVFLDFEASSLADEGYPIEVAWADQNGRSETHLIAPAPGWTDWDPRAEAIHGIARRQLLEDGESHVVVAGRMLEALTGHELYASAPSWDGKWLSRLLRAAGLPRHALRLRDTDVALRSTATELLESFIPAERLPAAIEGLLSHVGGGDAPPAHRALPDAIGELEKWLAVISAARLLIATVENSSSQEPR